MKKTSLKDMKKKNRKLILQTILINKTLSRIEIAKSSDLSPSTVSSIVSELLEEGILVESGEAASTGGRKRVELSINNEFASIAIIEVSQTHAEISFFDMQLNEYEQKTLFETHVSGNELFEGILESISDFIISETFISLKLAGIGLIFQEDMSDSEYSVMYSTSLSSAVVSLKDALATHFKVPIMVDYSENYTISYVNSQDKALISENRACIIIGQKLLVSIILNGTIFDVKGRKVIDITPLAIDNVNDNLLVDGINNQKLLLEKGFVPLSTIDQIESWNKKATLGINQITNAIKPLCMFFKIDTIFINGSFSKFPDFSEIMVQSLKTKLPLELVPKVIIEEEEYYYSPNKVVANLAEEIRNIVLL